MKISAHLDPWVLERELLRRIDAAHPRTAEARTLVLVPTLRLAEHVQRRLLEQRPAWLGVDTWPFRRLALEILGPPGTARYQVASPLLLEALLDEVLRREPHNLWSEFVARRPGALRTLHGALNDLREAGIEPGDLDACCSGGARVLALAALYRAYDQALGQLAGRGYADDAGLVRAALPGAASFVRRYGAVFLHGAYEWIGAHLDLLRELDRSAPVELLLPLAPGSRVSRHAETFAGTFLDAGSIETLDDVEGRSTRPGLAALFDEEQRPQPAPPGHFTFRHAQGAAAEVRIAVREALLAVREGCPPTEIVLVARSLEPHAAAIEEILEEEGLPWTSSLGSPLRRHPVVRDFLLLLRTIADDFPRQATAQILRSPRLHWRRLLRGGASPWGDRAELWSRQARIVGGRPEWTELLVRWAGRTDPNPSRREADPEEAERRRAERIEQARRIAAAVSALHRAVDPASRTWSAHAERLLRLLGAVFHEPDDEEGTAAVEGLRKILEKMERLETAVGDRRSVDFATMRSWLEGAVDGSELILQREDEGGLRVLDAMQLRGLTFRHVHLLGLNSGLTPRSPREDPVLTDELRRKLRQRTGRPLGVKADGASEERLLLALVLGAASERVAVSWQRADESGKAKTPSLALREIARLAFGAPDLGALRAGTRHLRSHPRQWLEDLLADPGLLAPHEEVLLGALHGHDRGTVAELGRRFPDLVPGLDLLHATQSFEAIDWRYDARIGPATACDAYSVTSLECLGRCPLQFFFRDVLRVQELDEPARAFELARHEIGNQIHQLLEEVYGRLRAEGLFESRDADVLLERGRSLLREHRGRILGELGLRQIERLPVLWGHIAESWFERLDDFVERDLARAHDEGLVPSGFEMLQQETLDFGQDLTLAVRGKFDRFMSGPERSVIGDYKTTGTTSLDHRSDPTKMLKGQTLQLPLYWMLAHRAAQVELLGIHPDLDPGEARRTFDGFASAEILESFMDSMRTLLRLLQGGSFPFDKGLHCDWCAYRRACRRNHPPTQEREQHAEDSRALRQIRSKSQKAPHGS